MGNYPRLGNSCRQTGKILNSETGPGARRGEDSRTGQVAKATANMEKGDVGVTGEVRAKGVVPKGSAKLSGKSKGNKEQTGLLENRMRNIERHRSVLNKRKELGVQLS